MKRYIEFKDVPKYKKQGYKVYRGTKGGYYIETSDRGAGSMDNEMLESALTVFIQNNKYGSQNANELYAMMGSMDADTVLTIYDKVRKQMIDNGAVKTDKDFKELVSTMKKIVSSKFGDTVEQMKFEKIREKYNEVYGGGNE